MNAVEIPRALPAGARLLYVGAPRMSAPVLEEVASGRRAELLEAGVRYPGKDRNHERPLAVPMRRRTAASNRKLPPRAWWDGLRAELGADPVSRVLISSETLCEADLAGVERIRNGLGPNTFAVIELRNFGETLPALWQRRIRAGYANGLEDFLRDAMDDLDDVRLDYVKAFHQSDDLHLVTRWARALGPQNVFVVVPDENSPATALAVVEGLLGLAEGALAPAPSGPDRALTLDEAELVNRLNVAVKAKKDVPRPFHRRLVTLGVVEGLVQGRTPGEDEKPVQLQKWALPYALEAGRRLRAAVRASGATVIGDLDVLERPVPVDPHYYRPATTVPTDVAATALVGMFASALGRPVTMEPLDEELGEEHPAVARQRREEWLRLKKAKKDRSRRVRDEALAAMPTGELVSMISGRVGGGLRRRARRVVRKLKR